MSKRNIATAAPRTPARPAAAPSRRAPIALLLATTALTSPFLIASVHAQTLPTGASVAAGSVAISQPSATQLTVTQSSQSAVVNYQSFSVGQGANVTFAQPNASSAILNRVTGNTSSNIAGSITANGSVYLVNPNGIAITPTGTVNAGGGFVASTLGISDSDFMAGRRSFTGNGASAGVSNAGTIRVGRGGYAALIGGTVSNAGSIDVPLGKVGLGSGERATLDFAGDGFLQVAMPTASGGRGALIRNSGTIKADGGSVIISAATAREAARNAINISGTVQARSISGHNGSITIGGGGGGNVKITGKLIATSRAGTGGGIAVTGRNIKLKGAIVDASGATGGGTINIGGGRQGTGPLQRAQNVTVDAATTIKADATQTGNGGNVVVWSDDHTTFAGTINARGGALSGNGGEVEVSGKATLAYTGFTDLSASHGRFGNLLLDPYNVTISANADRNQTGFTATGNNSVINVTTLQTALAGANVTVSTGAGGTQNGDITVAAPVAWSAPTTLTLQAYHSIAVNANISVQGGGGLELTTNNGGTGGILSFAQGASASFAPGQTGQSLTINSAPFTLVYTMAQLDAIDGSEAVNLTPVTQYGAGLAGSYALAGNLDASATTYTGAVIGTGGAIFSGALEGLGHSITGLTINAPSSNQIGLLGRSSGTVSNISVAGGSIVAGQWAGGLVGDNSGTIARATVSASVSGDLLVGGLVGYNSGAIAQAFTTGPVSGSGNVGGLVGYNNFAGTIAVAYATGAVTGSGGPSVGGLVGVNVGTISQTYATGQVSGSGGLYVGGLIGNHAGTVTQSVWNTETSGQPTAGIGFGDPSGVTGQTTGQLQSGNSSLGDVSLTSPLASGGGVGAYPYLRSFYPAGVQPLSGTVYADRGVTPLSGGRVTLDIFGSQQQVSTGANGYYYVALPAGTLSASGTPTLVYTTANSTPSGTVIGAALISATGTTPRLDIWGSTLIAPTTATSLTTAPMSVAALATPNAALFDQARGSFGFAGTASLTDVGYIATAAGGFTVDMSASATGLYARTTVGPLTVATPQTVATATALTLDSPTMLSINAPITARGTANVGLAARGVNDIDGFASFAPGAALTFVAADGTALTASAGGRLSINGNPYALVYTMAQLDAIDGVEAVNFATVAQYGPGLSGRYALANTLDASGTTYAGAPVATQAQRFRGRLDGLGHTITGLTIDSTRDSVGLIGAATGARVGNIGIVEGRISASYRVGGLIGDSNTSQIESSFSTADVTSTTSSPTAYAGGLVGSSFGDTIRLSYATGNVTGVADYTGGLVGSFEGGGAGLVQSYATGRVSGGEYVGGLVGFTDRSISQSYATGSVSGTQYAGGLVGANRGAEIASSYATGNVVESGDGYAGGLVGSNDAGQINQSYATGNVSGTSYTGGLLGSNRGGTIRGVYATGNIAGGLYTGGLVGDNFGGGITLAYAIGDVSGSQHVGGLIGRNDLPTIAQAYATGRVSGDQNVGGLVGTNQGGTVTQTYATGSVSGNAAVGGLIGNNTGSATQSYWDTQTSGQPTIGIGAGTVSGVTGLTTAQFQSGNLPAGFASTDWGSGNGLYPYLITFFPTGVQAVSGIVYADRGVTPADARVTLDIGGTRQQVSTGANGYYYRALAAGTLQAGGTATLAYTTGDNTPSGTVTGATLISATGTTPRLDIWGSTLIAPTTATSLSTAPTSVSALTMSNAALFDQARGSFGFAGTGGLTGVGYIATAADGFTIDTAAGATGLYARTTAGPLIVTTAQTVADMTALTLDSANALRINAPITARGAGVVNINFDASDPTNLSFGQGATLTYLAANGDALASSAGGALSVNGQTYTLVYTMAQLDAIDGKEAVGSTAVTQYGAGLVSGRYALAGDLDASGTIYTAAVIGTGGSGFRGTLEGLGHTITGLTINAPATIGIGLAAAVGGGGTLRDIGLVGGSVSGRNNVGGLTAMNNGTIVQAYATGNVVGSGQSIGGLAGQNAGTILQAYATGNVAGGQGGSSVGGLVGTNFGKITQAFATGAVSGQNRLGGLVGFNDSPDAIITQSYATGAVSGGSDVAGLVGVNNGNISQSYATGAVSGDNNVGGLVASSINTITQSYWDTQTSGQSSSSRGGTGITTAQFQSGILPSGFSSAAWGIGSGLYPYLRAFYPTGVQAVSGIAYRDAGTTLAASGSNGAVTVSLASGGAIVGHATTGANGYYYIAVANGALPSGAGLVTSVPSNGGLSSAAASFVQSSGNPVAAAGLDLSGGWRRDAAGTLTTLSALDAAYATAIGSTPAASLILPNREIAAGSFALDASIGQVGTLSLIATGAVTQTAGAVTAAGLRLSGGDVTIDAFGNQIGAVAGSAASLSLRTLGDLATTTLTGAAGTSISGVTTSGTVSLSAFRSLTLASGAGVSGANPVLIAPTAFINNAGAGAVTATVGRWLILSGVPGANTFGGLDSGNTAIWSNSSGAVEQAGNRYVFALQPELTVTSNDRAKVYGENASASVAAAYTITGFDPGVAGAYLADTAATALTGAPSVTSAGSAVTASVTGSPYAITVAAGTLGSPSNYAINFVSSGRLTVGQRGLTITADAQSRIYGDTNPALTYSVGGAGLVNGDTLNGGLATNATAMSNVGNYAIMLGSLAANANYALSYGGANLTVGQRSLVVTADAQSRIYGDANPALSYRIGGAGLVNGDALSGGLATSATTASNVGSYDIIQGSLAASPNYALSYVGSNLNISQRGVTVTADAQNRIYGDANPALTYSVGGAGLVNGDALSGGLATSATTASNVGSYDIIQGSLAASPNYALSYVGSNLNISQRGLTVIADAQSRIYGDANPALTYSVGGAGLVNGDALSGGLATSATTASNVGSYAIIQGSLAASSNYALAYRGANLTVTSATTPLPPVVPVTPPASAPTIDASLLASSLVRGVEWFSLPDDATRLVGVPPIVTTLGTGVFYSDPRYAEIFVCFGRGTGIVPSCYAVR